MNSKITGAGVSFAMLIMAPCPAFAEEVAAPASAIPASDEKAPLVPADFHVPTSVETASFKLVPLGPDLVKVDFDAYMSSIEHLQATFTRSKDWPHKDISAADAMRDMETEQARFNSRKSFAYGVLTPDGSRERGSVYVSPSPVPGYDAVVRLWVTKAE
ncbi:MAG TPA: twin-arginine translocation pathway signal protein, partial [Sphingomonadaceae bacterium]|nr:twin-arginine translocation pathway signal protein [Sphingomonadaceae bacterium]